MIEGTTWGYINLEDLEGKRIIVAHPNPSQTVTVKGKKYRKTSTVIFFGDNKFPLYKEIDTKNERNNKGNN